MKKTAQTWAMISFTADSFAPMMNARPDAWPPEPIDPARAFKWQTRRLTRRQPPPGYTLEAGGPNQLVWVGEATGPLLVAPSLPVPPCRYGRPGSLLLVREAIFAGAPPRGRSGEFVRYASDGALALDAGRAIAWPYPQLRKVPATYMGLRFCRTMLKVMGLRLEPLQNMSPRDAEAEGYLWQKVTDAPYRYISPRDQYAGQWDAYHVTGYRGASGLSWDTNPWVYVIEFMRMALSPAEVSRFCLGVASTPRRRP